MYVVDDSGDSITEGADEGQDRVETSIDYSLGSNIEDLWLTGLKDLKGTGNGLNNIILGNAGNNQLIGGAGDDVLLGGLGQDSLDGGSGNDTASYSTASTAVNVNLKTGSGSSGEALGDKLVGIENLEGSAFADQLTGDDSNNRLDGGKGKDQLTGGKGNDVYVVDDSGDAITEAAGEGTDKVESSVSYKLSDNIEEIKLTGEASYRDWETDRKSVG